MCATDEPGQERFSGLKSRFAFLRSIVLNQDFDQDFDLNSDEPAPTFVRIKANAREQALTRPRRHRVLGEGQKKASFEASTAEQRLVKQQSYDHRAHGEELKENA